MESRKGARSAVESAAAPRIPVTTGRYRPLVAALVVLALGAPQSIPAAAPGVSSTRAHVTALADKALAGRLTGSEGERRAGDYIIAQLKAMGASPLPGRDYRQAFEFTAGARDGGSSITVGSSRPGERSTTYGAHSQVQALSISANGTASAPLIFAGYGITVPEGQGLEYDSYAGLDVRDKIVLVLRYFPEKASQQDRNVLVRYADLRYKALAARQRGARALLVVTGPNSPNAGQTIPMSFDTALAGSGIVAASISAEVAAGLLAGSGRSLKELQDAQDSPGPFMRGFDLPGVAIAIKTEVLRERRTTSNILAYLPAPAGSSLDKRWIVLGAHYDHLGTGEAGNSLAGKEDGGQIHPGADDNASGTAAVLEAANALRGQPLRRNVMLAFWSGEEFGLLGSTAFIAKPPIPLTDIAAYLNFDMVGRMRDNRLIVQATGTSPAWPRLLEQANAAAGFDLILQEDPYQPTDVMSFEAASVPSLSFFTGAHADYHRPSDTADKINYEDLDRVAAFAARIAVRLAESERPPVFAKVEVKAGDRPSRAGVRVYTGTIPEYASTAKGLQISGVVGGGPADRAGLQKGDLIVEFAGQSITNIYDYTYALDALKIGTPVKVVYLRNGERRETVLTPEARK
jgi:Peptidase family M28/PDZ domain